MTNLYAEHLDMGRDGIKHERFKDLQAWEYKPEIEETKVVPSGSEDHAYLVSRISVLSKPFPDADVIKDRLDNVYLCSCDDFYFNRSNGVENGDRKPHDIGECKHCRAAFKHLKAENDEKQETIA